MKAAFKLGTGCCLYEGLSFLKAEPTLARFFISESEAGREKKPPRSKGIRFKSVWHLLPFQHDKQTPDARPAAAAAMTDLEAEMGQGYGYTCVAYLHPFVYKLER